MQLLQLLISGVAQGCIYGLIALGFVLIYKATETVSFAQGDLMMVGAFSGLAAMTLLGFPFWIAVPSAIVAMGVFGAFLERLVIRPILGQPAFSIVMLTIGVGYVLRGLITMIPDVGTDTHTMPVPYAGEVLRLGGLVIAAEQMVVIGATAILCLGLFAMFKYSKLGIAMQAASQNQLAAYYMGIPVKQINGLVWGLAASVAAVRARRGRERGKDIRKAPCDSGVKQGLDGAVRAAIAAGASLESLALLDNFCWCSSFNEERLNEILQTRNHRQRHGHC